jgi:pimeloyl-ACP methyl ester carboxylesterase
LQQTGLVSVNSYLILDLSVAWTPLEPPFEVGFWYFYYFLSPRGVAGFAENFKELARVVWTKNSPDWNFTESDLDRAATTYNNPDYMDVVVHCYRVRLLYVPADPRYVELEARLLLQPPITVPVVTLDSLEDRNFPATNGFPSAKYFTGPRVHHEVPRAGHSLPREQPVAFADAVRDVATL